MIDKKRNFIILHLAQIPGKGFWETSTENGGGYIPGNTQIWRLETPTQVLRNSVFYVNKCGYKIVRVAEFDKQKEHGMSVFEKRKEDWKWILF